MFVFSLLGSLYRGLKLAVCAFYYNWGLIYARWGQTSRALWYFNRAAGVDHSNDKVFYHRGVLFIAMGAPERAIMDFNMAIRNNPRFRDAYMNRSMMYTLIGRHEDARPDVEQAVALGADRALLEQQIEDLRIRNGGR